MSVDAQTGRVNVAAALEDIRAGRFVLVTQGTGPELGGDAVMAAAHASEDAIAFLARHCRGIVHVSLPKSRCDELRFPPVGDGFEPQRWITAVTVSIDARDGVTTGISAADRARTLRAVADPSATHHDFVRPGHVVPIAARDGGVLERANRSEAASDLPRLAGLAPVGVSCGILREDGASSRGEDLLAFAGRHRLRRVSVEELIAHRLRTERLVTASGERSVVTGGRSLRVASFHEVISGIRHAALLPDEPREALAWSVHRHCWAGQLVGPAACRCGERLAAATARIRNGAEEAVICVDLVAPEGADPTACVLSAPEDACVSGRRAAVIEQILEHLGIRSGPALGEPVADRPVGER